MSVFIAVHIRSDQLVSVQHILVDWLKSVHHVKSVNIKTEDSDFPLKLYDKTFISSEDIPPTILAIGRTQSGWITVCFNSFYDMKDIVAKLSREQACLALIIVAESVSESYYLDIYQQGDHLRSLHWSGDMGGWLQQEGQPLPFEEYPLGTNLAKEGDVPFYEFGRPEVEDYCFQLGLQVWGDPYYESDWIVLSTQANLML